MEQKTRPTLNDVGDPPTNDPRPPPTAPTPEPLDTRTGATHRPKLHLSFTTPEEQRADALAYRDSLRQQGLAVSRASIRPRVGVVPLSIPTPQDMVREWKDEDSDSPYADSDDGSETGERGGLLAPGYDSPGVPDSADEYEHHVHGPAGGMRVSPYPGTVTHPTQEDTSPLSDHELEESATRVSEVADRIELSMGTQVPVTDCWEDVHPDLREELGLQWPIIDMIPSQLAISTTHDVVRVITFDPSPNKGGTIRYITPHRTWSFTVAHRGGDITAHPPLGTPHMHHLLLTLGAGHLTDNQAELRLSMMELWPASAMDPRTEGSVLKKISVIYDDNNTPSFFLAKIAAGAACPSCESGCKGPARVNINRFASHISIRCPGREKPKTTRLSGQTRAYLFGGRFPPPQRTRHGSDHRTWISKVSQTQDRRTMTVSTCPLPMLYWAT